MLCDFASASTCLFLQRYLIIYPSYRKPEASCVKAPGEAIEMQAGMLLPLHPPAFQFDADISAASGWDGAARPSPSQSGGQCESDCVDWHMPARPVLMQGPSNHARPFAHNAAGRFAQSAINAATRCQSAAAQWHAWPQCCQSLLLGRLSPR